MVMRLPALLSFLLLFTACGGPSQAPQTAPQGALPLPLPRESGQPGVVSPAHSTSALVEQEIVGSQFYAKNASSFPSGNLLIMSLGTEDFAWVIYELPNVSADYYPTKIEIFPNQQNVEFFAATANYSKERWEYVPQPLMGFTSFTIGNWEELSSPSGSLYLAVLQNQGIMSIERVVVTLQDTRPMPAPVGLAASPLDSAAQLSWEEYGDPRADELRIFRADNEQMTGAMEVAALEPNFTARRVDGLANGLTYYFGLTAFWEDEPLESPYSNIVSVTPNEEAGGGGAVLSGIWPRRGGSLDNSSASEFPGPPSFDTFTSVSLSDARPAVANRTTPSIDDNGSVFALSADAVLRKYSADLSTLEWEFAAADNVPARADYICLPHSPVLDADGNAFFVAAAAPDSQSPSYIFSVDSAGEMNWLFDAGELPSDVDKPYPTPNITAAGILVALIDNLNVLVGIDSAGEEVFRHNYRPQVQVHGDLAISAAGNIEVPVWFSGIGVGQLDHWVSISALDGSPVALYEELGGFENLHGGLPLGPYHIYPEQNRLMLLDSASGLFLSQYDFATEEVPVTCAPARSLDGEFIFCAQPPYGFSGLGDMRCFTINEGQDPPQIENRYIKQLSGGSSLTSQPAVDIDNTVFMADEGGNLYRITYDETLPVSDDNPLIADQQKLGETDSFVYSSFALGNEVAYIINEDNELYVIWNPLDQ